MAEHNSNRANRGSSSRTRVVLHLVSTSAKNTSKFRQHSHGADVQVAYALQHHEREVLDVVAAVEVAAQ